MGAQQERPVVPVVASIRLPIGIIAEPVTVIAVPQRIHVWVVIVAAVAVWNVKYCFASLEVALPKTLCVLYSVASP